MFSLKNYGLWHQKCMQELYQKGYNIESDSADIIVTENGNVHFFGNLDVVSEKVTPWVDSEYNNQD